MTVNPLQAILTRQGFVMLDGGLATEMENHGADLDDELWSARMLFDAPELIRLVHLEFLKAGADVIATATYQASFDGFERAGFRHGQAERLMRLSVDLAVLAREIFWADTDNRRNRLRPLIAASIGPYGACLHDGSEYHGNYPLNKEELMEFHRPRMQVLADTDADLFAFETIPSRLEAQALLDLLHEFPGKTAWLSFSCRDAKRVSHGELFSECAALADQSDQVVGVGFNCTSPDFATDLLQSAEGVETPLVVYPNSGEQWNPDGNRWMGDGCQSLSVAEWYEAGARILGGCCRITAGGIARIRGQLEQHLGNSGST